MGTADQPGFGDLLARYRRAAGLTQEELAERAGLSTRGVSDLERGLRRRPHPESVRLLARALALPDADRAALLAAARPPSTARPRPPHPSPTAARPRRCHSRRRPCSAVRATWRRSRSTCVARRCAC